MRRRRRRRSGDEELQEVNVESVKVEEVKVEEVCVHQEEVCVVVSQILMFAATSASTLHPCACRTSSS